MKILLIALAMLHFGCSQQGVVDMEPLLSALARYVPAAPSSRVLFVPVTAWYPSPDRLRGYIIDDELDFNIFNANTPACVEDSRGHVCRDPKTGREWIERSLMTIRR